MTFVRFIGIDYSGAEAPESALSGLRVFEASPSKEPFEVRLTGTGDGKAKNWCRESLALWLRRELERDTATLVGIDHAFSLPNEYFEKYQLNAWPQFLEDFCTYWPTAQRGCCVRDVIDGSWWNGKSAPSGARTGETGWFRLCEKWTPSAKSTFLFGVQGQVAMSTHAGIPWLRWLRGELGAMVHWWPFDGWSVPEGRHVVCEVYPAIFRNRYERRDGFTGDQHDAYAVARWMQGAQARGALAGYFNPPLLEGERRIAAREGWILGVT